MRGYGRDYENRSWIDRAGETVRGWFGGGRDYDQDYGGGRGNWEGWDGGNARSMHRDWDRGMDRGRMMGGQGGGWNDETDWRGVGGGGYRMNNWNNQHASRDTVERHLGGYYGADYEDRGNWGGGMRHSRMAADYGRDYNQGWSGGRNRGMMGRGGSNRGGWGGNSRDAWFGNEYGGGGYNAGNDWGDYNRNGLGGERFRNSSSGGVEPGRYFNGYGIGSSGGNGYEPF